MKVYKILWVDDDFNQYSFFDDIINSANEALSRYCISLDIKKRHKFDSEINNELITGEYKLFITDIKINNNDIESYTLATSVAINNKIHYIIYSSYIEISKGEINEDLCIARLEKKKI